ncbi:DNA methyltransferase [Bifidobacterium animalis subsp. animalis]|nr:DNA methyltransferase [Bifidobacterium animalis subsp. animalis]
MPESVDIIIGGPPCQGFSTLGKQDQEDKRNTLWYQYVEAIHRTHPRYFVMENVPAFLKSRQYESFTAQTQSGGLLEDYTFRASVLTAADFDVPQMRHRAVIIGRRRDCRDVGFPIPTSHDNMPTLRDAIGHLEQHVTQVDLPANRSINFADKKLLGPFRPEELQLTRNYSDLSLKRFASIPYGGNRFDIPEELLAPCWKGYKSGAGDVMGRLEWEKPSVTIRTEFFKPEKGRYLHPVEDRAITLYEAALLQGFPSTQRFVGSKTAIARQIGNAVPVNLAKAIASQMLKGFEYD